MKKQAIGHVDCPVCPFKDAHVKEDRNGHSYVHCPDCNTQVFTRNEHRDHNLRKRMRPVTVTVTEPTAPEAVPNTAPKGEGGMPAAPVPTKAVPAAPKAKKSSWLQPILAQGGE